MIRKKLNRTLSLLAVGTVLMAGVASATPITVTITNNSQTNGLNLTPLFVAFHNGSFDAFDVGSPASTGVENIAELGDPSAVIGEATAADPNALTGVITAPAGFAGAPIIEPGETTTMTFDVDPTSQRFFSYLSMVIPSNDTFIGNDNALALFDAAGTFLGDQTLIINGNGIWDAGTEANDLGDGPAFVVGQDATGGTDTMDGVSLSNGIAAMAVALPTGNNLAPGLANFANNRDQFQLATITISADPVPLPAALPLMAAGLGAGAFIRRKKKGTA